MSVLRIQRLSSREAGGRPKGYISSYRFLRDDVPIYQCHAYRSCMKPSEFTSLDGRQQAGFVLKPSRQILPTTWIVEEKSGRLRHGTLKRKLFGKVDWKLRDAEGRQLAVFVGFYERRFWLIRFIDFFMGSNFPYRYELISNGETLATMGKEQRPDSGPVQNKRIFAKLLGKALVNMDWVVRDTNDNEGRVDHRLILSGAVLLNQVNRDISGSD
jgi:hypothetical protein